MEIQMSGLRALEAYATESNGLDVGCTIAKAWTTSQAACVTGKAEKPLPRSTSRSFSNGFWRKLNRVRLRNKARLRNTIAKDSTKTISPRLQHCLDTRQLREEKLEVRNQIGNLITALIEWLSSADEQNSLGRQNNPSFQARASALLKTHAPVKPGFSCFRCKSFQTIAYRGVVDTTSGICTTKCITIAIISLYCEIEFPRLSSIDPGVPLNRIPFHGPDLNLSVETSLTINSEYAVGSSLKVQLPLEGSSDAFHDDRYRSRPVTVFLPSFISGRNVSPG
ncbi:hypothetical protein SADUNF_Sadunf11G0093700 [Salix dunnii]|uniref:Uncharacterized protein n=1 Tax=Salix dunnii TaxID=1413687 RepID=A0A835JNC6_9ROSI|nr:hypothetical protein SADUNF_Sadunf11G0093700 [Salix dunnii]